MGAAESDSEPLVPRAMGEIGAGQDFWEKPEVEDREKAGIGEISRKLERCSELPNGVPRYRMAP